MKDIHTKIDTHAPSPGGTHETILSKRLGCHLWVDKSTVQVLDFTLTPSGKARFLVAKSALTPRSLEASAIV